jgi:hypothetical protein
MHEWGIQLQLHPVEAPTNSSTRHVLAAHPVIVLMVAVVRVMAGMAAMTVVGEEEEEDVVVVGGVAV